MVAKGNEQIEGKDFLETFALVVRWTTIKTIIAIKAQNGWKLNHLDVITAIVNDSLQEDVYMIILPGFPHAGKICRLLHALYGL